MLFIQGWVYLQKRNQELWSTLEIWCNHKINFWISKNVKYSGIWNLYASGFWMVKKWLVCKWSIFEWDLKSGQMATIVKNHLKNGHKFPDFWMVVLWASYSSWCHRNTARLNATVGFQIPTFWSISQFRHKQKYSNDTDRIW